MVVSPTLVYLVLRCADIDKSRVWYESLGFLAVAEKHGSGPLHYSMNVGRVVLELYPQGAKDTSGIRVGLAVSSPSDAAKEALSTGGKMVSEGDGTIVLRDPDGHTVELSERLSRAIENSDTNE